MNTLFKLTLVAVSSTVLAGSASAAPLTCVQRAIDWNLASTHNAVTATVISMHEIGVAAFEQKAVTTTTCSGPIALDGCLHAPAANALMSDRKSSTGQRFDQAQPLSLQIESLRNTDTYMNRLRAGSTTYDFTGRCIGNLLVGEDQWGNHWTIAFQLGASPVF